VNLQTTSKDKNLTFKIRKASCQLEKTPFLVELKEIFGPSYFVTALKVF